MLVVRGTVDFISLAGFRAALDSIGPGPLVIDFCACTSMHSGGDAQVIQRQKASPGTLAVVCVPDSPPSRMYHLSIAHVVPIYASRQAAITAAAAGRAWARDPS